MTSAAPPRFAAIRFVKEAAMAHRFPSVRRIDFGTALSVGVLVVAVSAALAVEPHHTVVTADTVSWGPAPPSLPRGAQAAALVGHPSREGPFVLRLKFPAGYMIPPHRHSKDEFVTVISGKVAIGAGDKVDRSPAHALAPAAFVHLPASMPHHLWTEVESVVQINGVGPFDVTYLDSRDDPRKP
jgi:hypothetical protein